MVKLRTLYEKIWDAHVVERRPDGTCLIYIDRHLVHEVTSPQAFEGLRLAGRKVRRPDLTLAVPDHNLPTTPRRDADGHRIPIADPESAQQLAALERNAPEFGVRLIGDADVEQGIVVWRNASWFLVPYVGASLTRDTEGYSWNDKNPTVVAMKLTRRVPGGILSAAVDGIRLAEALAQDLLS